MCIRDSIFPQCRLRQTGLFCQLFQRQVLIHHSQVFEPVSYTHLDVYKRQGDDDFTPFRNIMNEYYARDTSRKIRSTFQSKGNIPANTPSLR